jgi:SIR2-like domain
MPHFNIVLPDDLLGAMERTEVQLFVGSGVSAASGLSGWNQLVDDMAQVIRSENTTFRRSDLEDFLGNNDHLGIAELFRTTVGENAYFRFLRVRYRKPEATGSTLMKRRIDLPVTTVFTTNYDHLLEHGYRKLQGIDPAVIISAEQLNYIGRDEIRIVKLHGDIDHPSTIVLTRKDYAEYGARHRDFVDLFGSTVNSSTVLFVGFGLRDPNFTRIYNDARVLTRTTARQAYAVMSDTNAVERNDWHDSGLTILPVQSYQQIPTLLQRLLKLVKPVGAK